MNPISRQLFSFYLTAKTEIFSLHIALSGYIPVCSTIPVPCVTLIFYQMLLIAIFQ